MKAISLALIFGAISTLFAQQAWLGNTTPTNDELIAHLQDLDRKHKEIMLYNMGPSDYGQAIYLCVINGERDSLKTFEKARNSTTLLINNAIHPGEPDGINACLIWLDQWIRAGKPLKSQDGQDDLPVIAFIPAYNVGGMYNRSKTSRANQNGPEAYGFRGSAKNLDLNRDFTKMDAVNTLTFVQIFQALDPDVFIDNHVSNGADYPYTLTYISSMKERLAPSMQALTYESCLPTLKDYCQIGNFELFPYIELKGETPEDGLIAFNDLPRYAMGYASLFHSLSFTVETHMLKPFPQRVQATLQFMNSTIAYMMGNTTLIEQARKEAKSWSQQQAFFRFNYRLDEQNVDSIRFKGFKAIYPIQPVTGLAQLEYDRSQPYEKFIPYYHHYTPQDSVKVPSYYIVGAQESQIISFLKLNGVQFQTLASFTNKNVYCQVVKNFKAPPLPYEGHFKLSNLELETIEKEILLKPGDILIPIQQDRALFIHSVLQGEAEDSYLSWNFFDSYLQQKEYFSGYVFKKNIAQILEENPVLKGKYEERKTLDVQFAKSEWDQLFFIYQNSPYFEQSFMRLPVYLLFN
jgi:hypothetical protein